MSDNIQQTIIDLLNQASLHGKDNIRVQHLRHVQELILRKDPNLLDHFLEEVLTFQTDKSIEVKKTIISFIEETCQYNPKMIMKIINNLHFLLYDDNVFVQKKLILSLISIYKSTLLWLSKSPLIDENVHKMWQTMTNMKNHIISQLNSDNNGLCIVVIKFIEMFIIILSEHKQDFLENDQKILSRIKFEQEEKDIIEKLFDFTLSQHLSNVHLIAAIEAITNIIRYRSNYINRVLQIFEILQNNLPSILIDSQVSNVRQIIKLKLFNLLKHSISFDFQPQIINLLTNFGATELEILKYLPKPLSESKRKLTSNNHKNAKKSKNIHYVKPNIDNNIEEKKFISNKINVEHDVSLPSTIYSEISSTSTNMTLIPCIQSKKMKFLNEIKPIEYDKMQSMSIDSFHRILHAEDICKKAGVSHVHKKIINSLVNLSEESFCDIYKDYIIADIHQRYDLAFAWLYSEYVHANRYLTIIETNEKKDLTKYDYILCQLLEYLREKDNNLFSRLLITVPLITDNALLILKRYCEDEIKTFGMNILHNLIFYRIPIREKCLDILFNLTENEKNFIRNNAICMTKNLYEKQEFKQLIERYTLKVLQTLEIDFHVSKKIWTEDSIRLCFSLYLSLIPSNHCLIQPIVSIYTAVNEDIKQIILRILEIPIREMGMTSPEILKLIKNCPKGAETLIIHIIHILTEQMPPSYELIENIRDLYYKRIPDVRFLIPILTNLQKYEILSILPKLIKLSPSIVKEVFNQLLGLNVSTEISHISLISPSEFLIALHEISLEECELKTIINATSLCFNERSIYTDNILAKILQELVEITPIPILFMRTVLQTLNLYPKMIVFIMNILQRLIKKQVWKQPRIWEGFIKFCEKTRPYSFPLLLQLPPAQLKHIFQIISELHDNLRDHLRSMSIAQRSSIPASILTMIEDNEEDIAFLPSS